MSSLDDTHGLITGGGGFIGRHVLEQLPPSCRVVVTHRLGDGTMFAAVSPAQVTTIRIDLGTRPLADRVSGRFDWAIHLAADVSGARSFEDPAAAIAANAAIAVNAVRGVDVANLVFASSLSVYGGLQGMLGPHRVPEPSTPYGVGKLAAEHLVRILTPGPFWIARLCTIYGPGEASRRLIAQMTRRFVAGDRTMRLTIDPAHRLDVMHVSDAARALVALAATPGERRPIDVTQGEPVAIAQLAERVIAASGGDPAELTIDWGTAAAESMPGWPSSDDLDDAIGVPRQTLDAGLRSYAGWVRAQASLPA